MGGKVRASSSLGWTVHEVNFIGHLSQFHWPSSLGWTMRTLVLSCFAVHIGAASKAIVPSWRLMVNLQFMP